MTEPNEIHSGLYRLSIAGQQPRWEQMQLRKAPSGRFGASLHAIGQNIYLYGGFGSRSAGSQNNDLVVLATYEDPGLIPVWVRTFNMSGTPQNRLHFASAALGHGVWVHGGYHVRDQQVNVIAEHELWYLNTYLDGPAKGEPCPKGYSRDPESADPCIDVGECPMHHRRVPVLISCLTAPKPSPRLLANGWLCAGPFATKMHAFRNMQTRHSH